MSYAWVNQGLAEGKQQGTLGALQDRSTEEKGSTRVNQEEGQKALDDVRRIITRGSVSRPKSLGGLVEERRNDKTATPLAKLKSELSEARERGELIGDNVCHTHVIFRNLQVHAVENQTIFSRILDTIFRQGDPGQPRNSRVTQCAGSEKHLLTSLHGAVHPGEMVLVLGRPGSGCTTFLKAVSGQLDSNCHINGELSYVSPNPNEINDRIKRQSLFCAADDAHFSTLSVKQTLGFAVNSKVGSLDTLTRNYVRENLMKIFNISHQADTLIGDSLRRGISGGEKKRVSIAEALLAQPSVACWDNSTLGLDAGSAADFVKCLRILTDTYKTTTFAALYQAADSLYESFDKVLVLEDGHQCFFGPVSAAKEYFRQLEFSFLPNTPLADYLTDCVDPRNKDPGFQRPPGELARIFRESPFYAEITRAQEAVHRGNAQSPTRNRDPRPPLSYLRQVRLTASRHAALRLQDKSGLVTKLITTAVVGIVVGTMYWQLPVTSAGAFTRGGVLFIALLYNAFTAFIELPSALMGRSIVNKHSAFGFYRRSALYLGQFCVDVPLAAIEILVFVLIVYFMAGLHRTVSAFFLFYAFIVLAQATMTVFFRTLGCVSKHMDAALRLASVVIMLMILTSGYMIPYKSIRPWIRWFYWLNPVGYDFSGMMLNEFRHLDLDCVGTSLVPNGATYNDLRHQVCTLAGAISQERYVNGLGYLEAAFGYNIKALGRNAAIMVIFIVGLLLCNAVLGELIIFRSSSTGSKVFKKKRSKLADVETNGRGVQGSASMDVTTTSSTITWEGINYSVPISRGASKQLLRGIDGFIAPGTLMALMGPSGAGKSTLLDVLAQRKTIGTIEGAIKIDGQPPTKSFTKGTGYCEQLDVHDPYQTVHEALLFSALLRQPKHVPQHEKMPYVEHLLDVLELREVQDALLGDATTGLSVEERKRVTIGVELAAKPNVLLFLDEPTSGLDSQSALSIVRFLRKLSQSGVAIVCTIHQPSAALFNLFDRLLLLNHGRTVYCGPTQGLHPYLTRSGESLDPTINVAEYALRMLTSHQQHQDGSGNIWAERWATSDEATETRAAVRRLYEASTQKTRKSQDQQDSQQSPYPTSFWVQVRAVTTRQWVSNWRIPGYASTRLFNHIVIALLTGLTYLNLDNSLSDIQYRIFVVFQVTVLPSLLLSQVEARYHFSRSVFYREHDSQTYSSASFVVSCILSEMPISLVCAVVFFVLLYFTVGFNPSPSRAGYQFLMIYFTENFSVSLGQAVAAATPSTYIASLFTPFLLITLSLMCGVTVPPPAIPKFWRSWLYRLNPFTYLVGGMVETELHELSIRCRPHEMSVFQAPPGKTCASYAASFLSSEEGLGYLVNPESTTSCTYCPIRLGDDYIAQFGLDWGHRWRDVGIMGMFWCTTVLLLFLAGTRLKFVKR